METGGDVLYFGGFALDLDNRRLSRGGAPVELGSRYLDALALLAREPGALVSKDRFMDEVWRGIPVTDEALTQCIRTLRRALGDEAGAPRFIATVPKHGYRFVAEVSRGGPAAIPPTAARRASGRIAGNTTLGGGAAGLVGGIAYGIADMAAGGGAGIAVLAALGLALGVLGGAGVGLGLAAADALRPGLRWAMVLGGALGGMAVGALGQTLGIGGVTLLTGTAPGAVTGLFEGLALGAAAGFASAARIAGRGSALVHAGSVGAFAGLAIGLAGGRMLGGSLLDLEARLPAARLALGEIVAQSETLFTMAEAALFVTAIVAAQRRFRAR